MPQMFATAISTTDLKISRHQSYELENISAITFDGGHERVGDSTRLPIVCLLTLAFQIGVVIDRS